VPPAFAPALEVWAPILMEASLQDNETLQQTVRYPLWLEAGVTMPD
jgi:hypothetical protein